MYLYRCREIVEIKFYLPGWKRNLETVTGEIIISEVIIPRFFMVAYTRKYGYVEMTVEKSYISSCACFIDIEINGDIFEGHSINYGGFMNL